MPDALPETAEQAYQLTLFLAMIAVAVAEAIVPRRPVGGGAGTRWARNAFLALSGAVMARAFLPAIGIGFAFYAADQGWGLFRAVDLPPALVFVASIAAMDFGRWLEHLLLHRVPWLWRVHSVHHSDLAYDFTTGLRFHPIEAVYTASAHAAVIALLGAPVVAVIAYEIVNVAFSVFVHGNLALPARVDRGARRLFVTPDVHRIHHSLRDREQQTNFAAVTPIWDRWLGTYRDQPEGGHEAMRFGCTGHGGADRQTLAALLVAPFQPGDRRSTHRWRQPTEPPSSQSIR